MKMKFKENRELRYIEILYLGLLIKSQRMKLNDREEYMEIIRKYGNIRFKRNRKIKKIWREWKLYEY